MKPIEIMETSWGRVAFVTWHASTPSKIFAMLCLLDECVEECDAFQYMSILKREVQLNADPSAGLR